MKIIWFCGVVRIQSEYRTAPRYGVAAAAAAGVGATQTTMPTHIQTRPVRFDGTRRGAATTLPRSLANY